MPNTWITDATHFLSEDGSIHPLLTRRGIVKHIGAIISAVSQAAEPGLVTIATRCRRRPGRVLCAGTVVAVIDDDDQSIRWECDVCADRGLISNWQGTLWDRRGAAPLGPR